jgi:hypothetical protein
MEKFGGFIFDPFGFFQGLQDQRLFKFGHRAVQTNALI